MLKKDIINDMYNLSFMDTFHNYPAINSIWRYQHRQRASFIKKQIDKYSSKSKILLDAGCGKGPYTYLSANKFGTIYSFDYSKTEVESAKQNILKNIKHNQNIIFKQVNLTHIPLKKEVVDIIILSETLEHIPNYKKALKEIHRVLKRDGIVIFSMPNALSFYWQYKRLISNSAIRKIVKKKQLKEKWELSRHWSFPSWKINNLVEGGQFKIIEKHGCFILPFPPQIIAILIRNFPNLFLIYDKLDRYLSKRLPFLSAFYLMILKK